MLKLIPLSSLEKVFSDEAPRAEPFPGCTFLRGEEVSFQVAFCSGEDAELLPEVRAEGARCFYDGCRLNCRLQSQQSVL